MPTPDEMMDAVTTSMKDRTGRSLDEWVSVVETAGIDPLDQNGVRRWLQSEHDVKQNTQWAIAFEVARRAGWEQPSPEQYAAEQYAGAKAALWQIFEVVRDITLALGDDVVMEGRSSYVPFVRRRQFAAIAAATKTRVDLGLRFTKPASSDRLTTSGVPGQSTHKVSLTSVADVDDEVRELLRAAYDQNG